MTKEGLKRRDELAAELDEEGDEAIKKAREAGEIVKCFLVRCSQSKALFVHVAAQKGDDEDHYRAKLVVADVEWLGQIRLTLKSDNESSIVSLRNRATRILMEFKNLKNI